MTSRRGRAASSRSSTRWPPGCPPDGVVVYAPAWAGAAEFDRQQPFPVLRHPTSLMLPVPTVRARAVRALTEHGCDRVLFGAAAPLGLLAPALRAAGARRIVAVTHGHEAGWAALPGARTLLRRIGDSVDVVTYLGEYFRVRLARALSPAAAARMARLAPGVDTADVPSRRGRGRDPGPARPGRPAGGGLRVPAGAPQGPGHPAARLARGRAAGAAIRRCCWSAAARPRPAASGWPVARGGGLGAVHRPGARG